VLVSVLDALIECHFYLKGMISTKWSGFAGRMIVSSRNSTVYNCADLLIVTDSFFLTLRRRQLTPSSPINSNLTLLRKSLVVP